MLLLCDVSKREVSTQPKLTVLPRAYRMLVWIAVALRIAEGMLSVTPHGPHQSRTHRGIEQTVTTNSSVRQFFAAPSKAANSKAVSVTRADVMLCDCELIVEQNIPLAKSDDTLTKAMKLKSKIL